MTMQNLHQADDGEFGMLIGFITPETERAMTVGGPKNCFEDRIAARQQKTPGPQDLHLYSLWMAELLLVLPK